MIRGHFGKFLLVAVLLTVALLVHERSESDPLPPDDPQLASVSQNLTPTQVPGAITPAESHPTVFWRVKDVPPPEVRAEVAYIGDLLTGETYFERNAEKRWPIASLTKLTTALTARALLGEPYHVILAESDLTILGGDVGQNLHAGEVYSVGDLLRSLLLVSSNESAEALASAYGRQAFIASMNRRIEGWGLSDTQFYDPTGLSPMNRSTARELALMAKHIYEEDPRVFTITRGKVAEMTDLATGRQLRISSNNQFAGQPDFLGGKTGYTDEARANLLSVFEMDGRPVIIIVMGVDGDRFTETSKLREWFADSFDSGS